MRSCAFAPDLVGQPALLFVWDLAGIPVLQPIASGSVNLGGRWITATTVPPGLAGLDVDFRTLVFGPLGGVVAGNHELVSFR